MPRSEPHKSERLERAALALFTERGYSSVNVVDIARRAGVAKATYFRVFRDKAEVLFWGQDLLAEAFAEGIRAGAPGHSWPELLLAALQAVATGFPDERRELARERDSIIDSHPELQERLAWKRSMLATSLAEALRLRGISDELAELAADIGRATFSAAYSAWSEDADGRSFGQIVHEELSRRISALHELARRTPTGVVNPLLPHEG